MWFFEDKSAEEIAAALGIKPTTVYKHIRKGEMSYQKGKEIFTATENQR